MLKPLGRRAISLLAFFLIAGSFPGARELKAADLPAIKVVSVPGGCFAMGDQFGDGGKDEKPVHDVCVNSFSLGAYLVTETEWLAVMGKPAPHSPASPKGNLPVTGVSWLDAVEFIRTLNRLSGKNYRLPSEAEWEYAARGGGKHRKFSSTDDERQLGEFACYQATCGGKPEPVGSRRPNELGLYDMSGNAWEWVADRYDESYYRQSPRANPQGDPFGVNRVIRGGSNASDSGQLRCSYRDYVAPDIRRSEIGFRLLLPDKQ